MSSFLSEGNQLCDAAEKGNNPAVELLLTNGAIVNHKDTRKFRREWTPLHRAAASGYTLTCSLLLEKGADLAAKNTGGRTPLHCAADYGHRVICSLFLKKGADITAKCAAGKTPLHYAALYERTLTCSLLLEKGADITAKDTDGCTPADLATGETKKFLESWQLQSQTPSGPSSSVPLRDVSVQELSIILSNLSFLDLIKPFERNAVSGETISSFTSYRDIIDIGRGTIENLVARTFFEDFLISWQSTGLIPKVLLQPSVVTPIANLLKGYINGGEGIMLVKTASLVHLLKRGDLTSNDILKLFWQAEGNIYSVVPEDSFVEVAWAELPNTPYAVMSYQWLSKWGSIAKFILLSDNRVLQEFMWIDVLCLDQMDPDKMVTIKRSDEIYLHAKEYHLMEIGSLFRGWVLFELSSVAEALLPPAIHISTQDPAAIKMMKKFLSSAGFDGCEFTEESDREVVQKKIVDRYGSVVNFNQRIIAIVNKIFV